jgi:hypothetical protein
MGAELVAGAFCADASGDATKAMLPKVIRRLRRNSKKVENMPIAFKLFGPDYSIAPTVMPHKVSHPARARGYSRWCATSIKRSKDRPKAEATSSAPRLLSGK